MAVAVVVAFAVAVVVIVGLLLFGQLPVFDIS